MRPAGTNEPLYSPERDLAHFLVPVYEHYVLGAFAANANVAWLDEAARQPPATEAQRQEAAERLRAAFDAFRDPDVDTAAAGFQAAGFWDCPAAARRDALAMLGIIIANKFFPDVRAAYGFPEIALPRMFVATPVMREAIEAGMETLGIDEAVRRGKGR